MKFSLNVYGNVASCTGSLETLRCDKGMQNTPKYIWRCATALHRILLQALLGIRTFADRVLLPGYGLPPTVVLPHRKQMRGERRRPLSRYLYMNTL
jgi:hypothetical protein